MGQIYHAVLCAKASIDTILPDPMVCSSPVDISPWVPPTFMVLPVGENQHHPHQGQMDGLLGWGCPQIAKISRGARSLETSGLW